MIHEFRGGVWSPTHVGRATWNFQRWSTLEGNEISWNSRSDGMVGPLDPILDAAFISDMAYNTDPDDLSSWAHDLVNVPLYPGGSGGLAITQILGRADDLDQLEGVTCDVQATYYTDFVWIQHQDIEVGGQFPGKFRNWLP